MTGLKDFLDAPLFAELASYNKLNQEHPVAMAMFNFRRRPISSLGLKPKLSCQLCCVILIRIIDSRSSLNLNCFFTGNILAKTPRRHLQTFFLITCRPFNQSVAA